MGGFQGNNIWSSGSPMAPFDQKVHSLDLLDTQFNDRRCYLYELAINFNDFSSTLYSMSLSEEDSLAMVASTSIKHKFQFNLIEYFPNT